MNAVWKNLIRFYFLNHIDSDIPMLQEFEQPLVGVPKVTESSNWTRQARQIQFFPVRLETSFKKRQKVKNVIFVLQLCELTSE